jgi:hypothetical protein
MLTPSNRAADVLRRWNGLVEGLRDVRHTPAVTWEPVQRMMRATHAHLATEGDRLRGLLARASRALAPLGESPLVDVGTHRWLRRPRDEASRDWPARMFERLEAPSAPRPRRPASRGSAPGPEEASGAAAGAVMAMGRGGRGGHRRPITPVEPAHCRACRRRIEPCVTTCPYCYSDVRPWAARQAPFVVVGSVLLALFLAAVALHVWTSVPR